MIGLLAGAAGAQPTVNGLFFGDGDDAQYVPYGTSEYGSVLYVYFDPGTNILYAALVVDHSVNDMVCSPSSNRAYTRSVGWNPPRDCKRASDSEFAEFTLECAPGSPRSWTWQQAQACEQNATAPPSNWHSVDTCPSSTGTWPPSITASTSFVANVNNYQSTYGNPPTLAPWNMYTFGTALTSWKSPFVSTAPDDATQVPGYPTFSGGGYQWEWSMVYEWSVHLAGDGVSTGTGCGNQPVFFVTGSSHHSPGKGGDENDDFPPITATPFMDLGDLPASYSNTLIADDGARHNIVIAGPRLGTDIQIDSDGTESAQADGDGSEEDGVVPDGSLWLGGGTGTIDITVSNVTGTAVVAAWFDWNGDGDFLDPDEYQTFSGLADGTHNVSVTVGAGFDGQVDDLYARFRLFSSGAAAPGGSLDSGDFVGAASDGEVEDYYFPAGVLPVTLNSFSSEGAAGGTLDARWQTASETDTVGFELWGEVDGRWEALSGLVPGRSMNRSLPETYELDLDAPAGLTRLRLVAYDSRGRSDLFGPYRLGRKAGAEQPVRSIDWAGPRAEREARLRERGFGALDLVDRHGARAAVAQRRGADAAPSTWKKLSMETRNGRPGVPSRPDSEPTEEGATTHLAVVEPGVQRVTYEALAAAGLDLAGVASRSIAVTLRGEPVPRWVDGPRTFGPGSAIELVGRPPQGDDALYIGAALYQVTVDRSRAVSATELGGGTMRWPSKSYPREETVDRPLVYHAQSPTGDPWIERTVLARRDVPATVTLDLPVSGPVESGPARLTVGLGTLTDLETIYDTLGRPLPEHNVEISFAGPGGSFEPVGTASISGQEDWLLELDLPAGSLQTGVNRVLLHFTTEYFFSLLVIDRWGVTYRGRYRGPSLDFPSDPEAGGYVIEGFTRPEVVAYAEPSEGHLVRVPTAVSPAGSGYVAQMRQIPAERIWVTQEPHAPEAFTTAAPGDLLAEPGDLVVIADPGLIGSPALGSYLASKSEYSPVVVDVEDVYNAYGYGMALPGAITDYLRARDAVHPFTWIQLVGTDCYDRLGYVSQCLSMIPLPTAPVGVTIYSPSQNRLADLDGDGVADKAIAQFSVRDEAELATIVGKGVTWSTGGLGYERSVLMIAEESDGQHDFAAQLARLRATTGWSGAEVLDMTDHPNIATARREVSDSLAEGRALTVFSGHSSPVVWAFRGLVTAGTVANLSNFDTPTLMVPLACETTYDISPSADVLGHQLLYGGEQGALAISGAVSLSSLAENEAMARHVLEGLWAGQTLGEAVLAGRGALGARLQELQDNWATQGDVTTKMLP